MRQAFMCSLCHRGLIGGGLYLDEKSVTYRCQKITVEKKYRELVLPLEEIASLTWRQTVFPIAAFRMESGEEYAFLIFNKRRFERAFREYRPQ